MGFSRLNECTGSLFERVHNRQLFCKTPRSIVSPSGRLPGQDVRNIRITRLLVSA